MKTDSCSVSINVNTAQCKACWECMTECKSGVFSRINLPWHKHIIVSNPDKCKGCSRCIDVCQYNALTFRQKKNKEASIQKHTISFIINNLLLFSSIVMIISGLLLQFGFHIGRNNIHGHMNVTSISDSLPVLVWGLTKSSWALIHKISAVIFTLFALYHIYKHSAYYKTIIKKMLIKQNKLIVGLSLLFIAAGVTGFIPWGIDIFSGSEFSRFAFVEVHDKLGLILVIYTVIHILRRRGWFSKTSHLIKTGSNKNNQE